MSSLKVETVVVVETVVLVEAMVVKVVVDTHKSMHSADQVLTKTPHLEYTKPTKLSPHKT